MWWKKTKKQNKEVPNTHRIPTFLHPILFSNISENMMQKNNNDTNTFCQKWRWRCQALPKKTQRARLQDLQKVALFLWLKGFEKKTTESIFFPLGMK